MISLEEYKIALGEDLKDLTEEQVLKLRDQHDQMAEIFLKMWIDEK